MVSQYLVGPVSEYTLFTTLLLMQTGTAFVVQVMGIGSAALFFVSALCLFFVLAINPLVTGSSQKISLVTYGLGQAMPLLTGVLFLLPIIEIFVPLVGDFSYMHLFILFTKYLFADWPYRWRCPC